MPELKPGWLGRQFDRASVDVATWPEFLRVAAGFDDNRLTPEQRKEAAAILRARANWLDPLDAEVSRG